MSLCQLIILGNGYDLRCGLHSDYESFFLDTILDDDAKKSGTLRMQQDCSGFWETLLFHYYEKFGKSNYKWCDIEALIQEALWLLYFGKSKKLGETRSSIRYSALRCAREKHDANYEFRNEHNIFIKYLTVYSSQVFSKCLQINVNYSDEELFHLLNQDIAKELRNLEKRFCRYLKQQIDNNHFKYEINAINLLSKIAGDEKAFSHIGHILRTRRLGLNQFTFETTFEGEHVLTEQLNFLSTLHVLSFNYTALFDILGVNSQCTYSNVHGKLCSKKCNSDCESSNIIFGIDDTAIHTQETEPDLMLFSKTYRKMSDTSSPTVILPSIENHKIEIKFFGHSLNKADYSYFQSIFDYYNIYGNSNVKLIFYYSPGYEQQDSIYRLMNEYGTTLANKDQGKNLIHKLLLENRLKIEEI